MDTSDLVTVYTLNNPIEAEIIKNAMQADGIRCFLDGANQAGETGLMALEIKVQVPIGSVDRARKLLEGHQGSRHGREQSWTEKR